MTTMMAIMVVLVFMAAGSAQASDQGHGWELAHATFYGDIHGGETMRKSSIIYIYIYIFFVVIILHMAQTFQCPFSF